MILRILFALSLLYTTVISDENVTIPAETASEENIDVSIIGYHWEHVETPFICAMWLLLASVAKILFHVNKKFGEAVPDSALLITMGLLLGIMLKMSHVNDTLYLLNSKVFFLYLLPPIIFDAGYFMPNRLLFENFGSVMMFAVVGTIWNTVAIGGTLALVSRYTNWFGISVSPVDSYLFSSLISAVDPVAVITVFEEIHVNAFLFINVFGEALFNDGIAAVLFQIFNKMTTIGTEKLKTVHYFVFGSSFFAVALGGALIGVLFAFVSALATKYTQRVKLVGPVFVFVIPYIAYLMAEMTGFSAILAICCCGIVMKQYVKCNITHDASASVKYFVKLMSQASETVVFMFLGLSAISSQTRFDWGFIIVTLAGCLIYRIIGVVSQCYILNKFRTRKFTFEDQFVMSYGGLRGAIAFGLLSSMPDTMDPEIKAVFTTTTIVVICFTVFLQGSTIRPLLSLLKVERQKNDDDMMFRKIYQRYIDYMMAGLEDVVALHGAHSLRDWFERMNAMYLKPILTIENKQEFDATPFVRMFAKDAMSRAASIVERRASMVKDVAKEKKYASAKVCPIPSQYGQRTYSTSSETDPIEPLSLDQMSQLQKMMSDLLDQKLKSYPQFKKVDDIQDDYLSMINASFVDKEEKDKEGMDKKSLAAKKSHEMV
ncbi:unnamed protein product [Bursaphelenchus okinawaensis]|uniref:Sodium/hydrogen exchanger n=1 Tax=Bursaphelenchus okinawaensis TaxID=465554 RepID=A0A811JWI6_9BILA|nr:unnamed protein product [Bursaphelenchus okinawaensis]CAG9086178.1 unnamed protein product [Bursaphelenchus okinawaensis]